MHYTCSYVDYTSLLFVYCSLLSVYLSPCFSHVCIKMSCINCCNCLLGVITLNCVPLIVLLTGVAPVDELLAR